MAQLAAGIDAALAALRGAAARRQTEEEGAWKITCQRKSNGNGSRRRCARTAPALIMAVALAVAAVYGWRWWQGHLDAGRLAAGARYTQMVQALERGDRSQALVLLGELERDDPGSPYTDQAKLLAARVYVDDSELDQAAARACRGRRAFHGSRPGDGGAAAPGARADRPG